MNKTLRTETIKKKNSSYFYEKMISIVPIYTLIRKLRIIISTFCVVNFKTILRKCILFIRVLYYFFFFLFPLLLLINFRNEITFFITPVGVRIYARGCRFDILATRRKLINRLSELILF